MIVDTHVYCYRAPDQAAGYPTVDDHMRVWQWSHATHHQPAFSTRDRRPGDARLLMARAPDEPWRIADRDFRVDRTHGRMTWTVDGEDFTKHILPPNALEFSAGACIGEMDYAGIDWALMHVDEALEKDNEFMASCVRAYPDRLRSMAVVDEQWIPTDPDRAIREAAHAIEELGLHALKIIPEYAYRMTDFENLRRLVLATLLGRGHAVGRSDLLHTRVGPWRCRRPPGFPRRTVDAAALVGAISPHKSQRHPWLPVA